MIIQKHKTVFQIHIRSLASTGVEAGHRHSICLEKHALFFVSHLLYRQRYDWLIYLLPVCKERTILRKGSESRAVVLCARRQNEVAFESNHVVKRLQM